MKKLAYGFVLAFSALCSAIALATDYTDDNFVGDIAPSQVIPLLGGVRKVYVFTDTSGLATLKVKRVLTLEKLLVVGGGGGGGGHIGGGGGGGGVIYSEHVRLLSPGEQIKLAVGSGGESISGSTRGLQGGTSSIKFGDDAIIEAFGGGGGAGHAGYATDEMDGEINKSRCGGDGIASSITGVEVYYGGGGGGNSSENKGCLGGLGGGGNGYTGVGGHGSDGTDGLGGGGGASRGTSYHGGRGGNGTVILAFKPVYHPGTVISIH